MAHLIHPCTRRHFNRQIAFPLYLEYSASLLTTFQDHVVAQQGFHTPINKPSRLANGSHLVLNSMQVDGPASGHVMFQNRVLPPAQTTKPIEMGQAAASRTYIIWPSPHAFSCRDGGHLKVFFTWIFSKIAPQHNGKRAG